MDYLLQAVESGFPALFQDYVRWVRTLFLELGFRHTSITRIFQEMNTVVLEETPPEIHQYLKSFMLPAVKILMQEYHDPPSYIPEDDEMGRLASGYLKHLLQGNRGKAMEMIMDKVRSGIEIKRIYLDVFQPVQREIGRLWQMNRITVAQEHYVTAATQLVMSQMYPYLFGSGRRTDRRIVAACVGKELHELGIRMVADFFEMEGWDTYYMGANTPVEAIISTIKDQQPDVLGLSATLPLHVGEIREMIRQIRHACPENSFRIFVGGYPFNNVPDLWKEVGADAFAINAQDAIVKASGQDGVQP